MKSIKKFMLLVNLSVIFLLCFTLMFYSVDLIIGYKIDSNGTEDVIVNGEKKLNISLTNSYVGELLSNEGSGYFYDGDDRIIVENSMNYPYRSVCKIAVKYDEEANTIYYGTGFLVGPYTLLTACHVVYNKDYGWFNSISFTFGTYYDNTTNSIVNPYGIVTDWNNASCGSYFATYDANDDWALIDFNTSYGNQLGYFGVSTTAISVGSSVKLIGYHGDLNGNLAYGFGTIKALYDYKFYHTCDTVGGSSGGPIVYGNNIAVGMQHGYFNDSSSAIACKISSYIVGWINERM